MQENIKDVNTSQVENSELLNKVIMSVSSVSKKYKKQFALVNVSFDLYEGEILGLVGPNGAGKTTLIRIITGLIKNYIGEIIYNEDNKNRFSCIVESAKFYPYLTGSDVLEFAYALYGSTQKKKINEVISIMNLSDFIKKKIKTYSLGMKQRLGLAQAFLGDPKILILDEPTNGLDPKGINDVRNYLKQMSSNKTSIIVSSHSLGEIEKICDRVVVLKRGNLIKILDMKKNFISEDKIFSFEFSNTTDYNDFMNFAKQFNIVLESFDDNSITIRLTKDRLYDLIKELVLKEIVFSSVTEIHKTLESNFLSLTGDN
jgi:ABC-2 type transport system ATP-binding protein